MYDDPEDLFVRNRVCGPSEHHRAMLDERNETLEPGFACVKHRVGCTDSNGDPRGEGPDVYSVSFRRHSRAMVVDSGQSVGI